MASFGGLILTNKGRALQAKAQAGTSLVYTRIGMGDGNLGGQQMPGLTALINAKKYLPINKITSVTDGKTTVSSYLSNAEITTGFFFRELGLFATDPDEGEILYCYGNAGAGAEYIPAGGGPDIVEKYINVVAIVGNATNVSAIINNSLVFVEQTEFDAHVNAAVLDHPDSSVTDPKIGNRSADPNTTVAYGLTGRLTQWISWFTKYLKAITGKSNPFDTPDITLAATKTHVDDLTKHITAAERTAWNAKQNALGYTPENAANKNQVNGYAGLDNSAKLPASLLPALTGDVTSSAGSAATTIAVNVVTDSKIGNRTTTDSVTPSLTGSLTSLLSSLFTLIKGITGKSSALTAPAITLEAAKTSIDALKAAQSEAASIPATIKRGLGVINTSQASGTDISIGGRTLVNLLGRDGNFENDSNSDGIADGWQNAGPGNRSIDYTRKKYGGKAQVISSLSGDSHTGRNIRYPTPNLKVGKYLYLVDAVTDGVSIARVTVAKLDGSAIVGGTITAMQTTTDKTLYAKIDATSDIADASVWIQNTSTVGAVGWVSFDGARLYQVSAAEYAKIDVDPEYTGEKLAEKFPYADSVKHLRNPAIRKKGRNLFPPFTQWVVNAANAKVLAPYVLQLVATAPYQYTDFEFQCLPNTQYTFSLPNVANQFVNLVELDAAKNVITFVQGFSFPKTWTTRATTSIIRVQLGSNVAGTFTFVEPQMELGGVATQFEPQNDDYLILPTTLASSVDGSVKDTYNDALGTVTRRHRTGIVLDGSLPWLFNADRANYKRVQVPAPNGVVGTAVKYDGKILERVPDINNDTAGDQFAIITSTAYFYLTIADSESGWDDAYTPTVPEIQAYFNGWQINNGTVGTKYLVGPRKWTPLVSPKADLEGKIAGSVVENPHIVKWGFSSTLILPNGSWGGEESQAQYDAAKTLDGTVRPITTTTNGQISQRLESKNLIEYVIRKHGSWLFGSAVTVAERVAWLKANVSKLVGNGYISGSGPAGNKVSLASFNATGNVWYTPATTTSATIVKVSNVVPTASVPSLIDANGFVHFSIYADASNGTIASGINIDTFDLDVELNVSVLPTAKSLSYTPYTLDYQLATTKEETVVAEGAIGLQAGGNQIELLEGVVIREKANPILSSGVYYINANVYPASWFKNKAEMIMSVYKNGVVDSKAKYPNPSGGYGNVTAQIQILEADFDATAEYTVTYLPLDKYKMTTNIIDATLTYQSTLGGTVAKNTQDITDIKTKDSVQDWRLMLDEAYALNTRFDLYAHIGSRGLSHAIATQTEAGFQSIPDKIKLDGIAADANNYAHPLNHPPSIITQDSSNRFVTDAEKATWNAKAAIASPGFTGTPTAPTAAVGTNTTQLSTVEFVQKAKESILLPDGYNSLNSLQTIGSWYVYNAVNAPIANVAFYIVNIANHPSIAGYVCQHAYIVDGSRYFTRRYTAGVWSIWTQISNETIDKSTPGLDLNTLIVSGNYFVNLPANAAIAGSAGYLTVIAHGGGAVAQTYRDWALNTVYERRRLGTGTWGGWSQLSNDMYNYTVAGTEINFMQTDGWYHVPGGLNAPVAGRNYFIHVSKYPVGNWAVQNAYDTDNWKTYTRRMVNGVWTAWAELYTSEVKPYASGMYLGSGTATRNITLPFAPSAVLIMPSTSTLFQALGTASAAGGLAMPFYNVSSGSATEIAISGSTMSVSYNSSNPDASANGTNAPNRQYHYIIFR